MRRVVMLEVIRLVAPRIPKGGTSGARAAMARAWQVRDQPEYPREDYEVLRRLCEAAQFTPGLWMLNRVATLWLDAADALRFAIRAPDDYVASLTRFFDLLEAGDGEAATVHMAAYLERHDAKLSAALGFAP
ncbi:MAG: FCD domain-containing protein [Proteobacteria bacterium]|nr:FCD domain-containing protein [Pseudomonadota bacterium]